MLMLMMGWMGLRMGWLLLERLRHIFVSPNVCVRMFLVPLILCRICSIDWLRRHWWWWIRIGLLLLLLLVWLLRWPIASIRTHFTAHTTADRRGGGRQRLSRRKDGREITVTITCHRRNGRVDVVKERIGFNLGWGCEIRGKSSVRSVRLRIALYRSDSDHCQLVPGNLFVVPSLCVFGCLIASIRSVVRCRLGNSIQTLPFSLSFSSVHSTNCEN